MKSGISMQQNWDGTEGRWSDGVQGASLPLEELVLHLPSAPFFLPAGSAPLPGSIHGLCGVEEDGVK